jgi:phage-related protein
VASRSKQVKITITGDASKLGDALGDAESDAEGFGEKFKKMAGGLAKVAAVGAAAAGAALTKGLVDHLDFDKGADKLAVQMGFTGPMAQAAGNIAGRLYADGMGESMTDVNEAVQAVGSQLVDLTKVSASESQRITTNAMGIADAFDIEVTDAVNSAGLLLQRGLADNADQGLDLLTATMQGLAPTMREPILEAADEYGQFFSDLGLNGEQMFGILKSAAAEGEWALDKTGDALKELTIRGTDMSKASIDAFDAAGLSAEDMASKLIAGGDQGAEALQQIANGLLGIEDPVERSNAAIALFGTPLEDLSVTQIPEFLGALTNAEGGLEGVAGAASRATDQLYDNAASKLEAFKRDMQARLRNFVGGLVAIFSGDVAGGGVDIGKAFGLQEDSEATARIIEVAQTIRDVVGEVVDFVSTNAPKAFRAVAAAVSSVTGFVRDNATVFKFLAVAVGGAVAALYALVALRKVIAMFKAAKVAVLAFNASLLANPVVLVVAAIGALIGVIVLAYQRFEGFRNIVDSVGRFLRDVFGVALSWLAGVWSGTLWPAMQAVGGWISGTLWPILRKVAEFIGNAYVAYVRALATVWTKVLWPALQWVFSFISGTLWPILQRVGGFIGRVFVSHVQGLARVWTGVLWPALQRVASFISGTVIPTVQRIISTFVSVASEVSRQVGRIVGFVTGIPGRISRTISGLWNGLRDGISSAARWVGDRVGDIVSVVTGIGRRIGDVASAISSPFRSAFESIKSLWNRTVGGFGFSVPSWVPGVGGKGFRIPKMHTGGYVDGLGARERLMILEAGESVRSRRQEARLQGLVSGLAAHAEASVATSAGVPVHVHLTLNGPVTSDMRRWLLNELDAAIAAGHRAPNLSRVVRSGG